MEQGHLDNNHKEIRSKFNRIISTKVFLVSDVISAWYFVTKPRYKLHPEKYDFHQIMLVLDGAGVYHYGDVSHRFGAGMMFFRPAERESYYEWTTANASLALISFICDSDAISVFDGTPIYLQEAELTVLLDVIKTGARICDPLPVSDVLNGMRIKDGTPDVVIGYVASSLERFLGMVYCRLKGIDLLVDERQKTSAYAECSRLVASVKMFLEENISNHLLISDICSHFGVSRTCLTKKFRIETGSGVMEYFSRIKIEEAQRMIREASCDFSVVAETLGFCTPAYFSKVFSKYTGMTPTQYSKFVSKRKIIR